MGHIRALAEHDIPRVINLHRKVLLSGAAANGSDVDHAYFKEMFLDTTWSGGQASLVYEDGDGTPIGFLGMMARRMIVRSRPIHAVITAHFIVEPTRRASLAGIELLRAALAGTQDLTLADEAGDISRKLLEGLGGWTELLYSLYWVRVLRPAEFAVARWRKGSSRAWTGLSHLADAAMRRLAGNPLRTPMPAASGEDLDADTLAACVNDFTRSRALRPEYDAKTARRLLEILARKPGHGLLRKVLVRGDTGEIAGWYLYVGKRGGVGEVLQVGAREDRIGIVLDHLFSQAWLDGMVAVAGRIDPPLVGEFSARGCFFHHRGQWTLIHSRDPEVTQAVQRGDAFLTRLEGEWSMRF